MRCGRLSSPRRSIQIDPGACPCANQEGTKGARDGNQRDALPTKAELRFADGSRNSGRPPSCSDVMICHGTPAPNTANTWDAADSIRRRAPLPPHRLIGVIGAADVNQTGWLSLCLRGLASVGSIDPTPDDRASIKRERGERERGRVALARAWYWGPPRRSPLPGVCLSTQLY